MKIKIVLFSTFMALGLVRLLAEGVKIDDEETITVSNQVVETVATIEEKCPYYVSSEDFPSESIPYANSVNVLYPPKPITPTGPVEKIHEKFDPKNSYDETRDLYVLPGQDPWQEYELDVDADGEKERILSGDVAMNHTPHIALVVKDGYVIFITTGAQTYITEVDKNNGFMLHETVDWNTGEEIVTRYVYKDGTFIPAWEQRICNVRVANTPEQKAQLKTNEELTWETVGPKLSYVPYYEAIFKKNGEWFGDPIMIDLTGDGKDEAVYVNVGKGCGSCHVKYFHIFQNEKEVFCSEFDDPDFDWLNQGFTVYEPIRLQEEPYCCPSSYSRIFYEWDGNEFIKKSSSLDNKGRFMPSGK